VRGRTKDLDVGKALEQFAEGCAGLVDGFVKALTLLDCQNNEALRLHMRVRGEVGVGGGREVAPTRSVSTQGKSEANESRECALRGMTLGLAMTEKGRGDRVHP